MKKRIDLSIFFTDDFIGFFEHAKDLEKAQHGYMKLESNIIQSGYIKDPELLLENLRVLFKTHKIKPRKITHVIHDQNVLVRDIRINKDELLKKNIESYIRGHLGKTIHLPFEESVITHSVRQEDENEIRVIAFIIDENLLHDYCDVFERLGAREVKYEVSNLPLYEHFINNNDEKDETSMTVSLYDKLFSIQIIENHNTIFNLVEVEDGDSEDFGQLVENFVERIHNYYKFNMRKGKSEIKKTIFFNFNDYVDLDYIQEKIINQLGHLNPKMCHMAINDPISKNIHLASFIPYVSVLYSQKEKPFKYNFNIKRLNRLNLYANYLFVLAFLIISAITLIYIPFHTMNEDIKYQQNRINNLQIQLDLLIEETPPNPTYTTTQIDYSNTYDFLVEQKHSPSSYVLDLINEMETNIDLLNYKTNASDNEIVITITALTEHELYEYLLQIYEEYGIVEGNTELSRWMLSEPIFKFTQSLVMEVTVNYA
ncbi:MAG: hypothetical protein NUK62_05865 [Tenericutes bacterium]|nr:hypothetical protein [Mycoplasmatota bacterium]